MNEIAHGIWGSYWCVDKIEDAKNSRIARDFIDSLLTNMIKNNHQFYIDYGKSDYPLRYDERRSASLVVSSVADITSCHLTEYPVERHPRGLPKGSPGKEGGRGRVDIWAYYRKTDILLELKQTWMNPNCRARSRISSAWSKLHHQIEGLEKNAKQWSDNYLRIGLLTILIWQERKFRWRLTDRSTEELFADVMEIGNKMKPQPSLYAAWRPPQGSIDILKYQNEEKFMERVPAVIFLVDLIRRSKQGQHRYC